DLYGHRHSQRHGISGDTEMKRVTISLFAVFAGFAFTVVAAQGLDPAALLRPLADQWPSYSGDYTGRRYSALTHVNQSNVAHLTLAWVAKITGGAGSGAAATTSVGGEGTGEITIGAASVKGA